MKAYDIYKSTLSLMFEDEGEDREFYDKFCGILSTLAAECLPYENAYRRAVGREELLVAPVFSDMKDSVDMCDELCKLILPYGVAAQFFQNDGEDYYASQYRERYRNALSERARCVPCDIVDVYGGEDI